MKLAILGWTVVFALLLLHVGAETEPCQTFPPAGPGSITMLCSMNPLDPALLGPKMMGLVVVWAVGLGVGGAVWFGMRGRLLR